MRYVEAPEPYEPRDGDGPAIFLAGGITGCEDWQAAARKSLRDAPVVLLNPRRADFDVTRGDSAAQQVEWEYHHLHLADLTMFWFPACDPAVTVQPIALFELGAAITGAKRGERRFVVGADERYPRLVDIELQLHNALPRRSVHRSLPDTVDAAMDVVTGLWVLAGLRERS